jgi:uncharacterized membrane protein YfcA
MDGWIMDVETTSAAAVTEMAAGGSWRHATARHGTFRSSGDVPPMVAAPTGIWTGAREINRRRGKPALIGSCDGLTVCVECALKPMV